MGPDARRILAFDTSGPWCGVAVCVDGRCLALRDEAAASGQAERLFGLIHAALAEAGLHLRDLTALGVGIGPGNFTGLRISVAAARGLSLSLGLPAIGVAMAEARAFGLPPEVVVAEPGPGDRVVLSHDARAPLLVDPDAVFARVGARPLTGGAAARVAAHTGGRVLPPAHPLPEAIAALAAARADGPAPRPAPLYLRPPDAAPPRMAAPLLLD